MSVAAYLVWLAGIWLWIGAAVAVLFLTIGIGRIDPDTRGAYMFRPLLVPGVLIIWPLVLWRWFEIERDGLDAAMRDRPLRGAHAPLWMVLAIVIPVIFVVALVSRQAPPEAGGSAVRLQPPSE